MKMEQKESNFYVENSKIVTEGEFQCCHWLGSQGFIYNDFEQNEMKDTGPCASKSFAVRLLTPVLCREA